MAVFIVIAILSAVLTKMTTNHQVDREYARQGLDSPRYKVKLAKLAAAGLPPSGAAVARPGAKGYFRALWDDAWEDLTDRHTRIRAAKKAGERPTTGERIGAAYRWAKTARKPRTGERRGLRDVLAGLGAWAWTPIGEREATDEGAEDGQRPAERPAPAPVAEPAAGQPTADGPVISCPDCGVALCDIDGRWIHRPDSTCIAARTERQGQDSAPRSSVVHTGDLDYVPGPHQTDPNYKGGPVAHCYRCQKSPPQSGSPYCNSCHNALISLRDAAQSAATLLTPHGSGQVEAMAKMRELNRRWGHGWTEQEMQNALAQQATPNPGRTAQPAPARTPTNNSTEPDQGEADMTEATGDVHDVESCKAELTALAEDLTRVDASLDVIDEAVRSIAAAAEQIEAWMTSKNLDGATIAGVQTILDALSPDRVKELIDAVDSAKQGVQAAADGLAPLEEAAELVGTADGSALNNR